MRSAQIEEEEEPRIYIKTIVLGDYGVGKSKLLMRFVSGEYREDYFYQIMDHRNVKVRYNSTDFWIMLCDTAGMERLRVI